MPILPCKRLVGVLVSSAEDYKEPEEAFKKVIGDKIGFEDYFLNEFLIRERLSVIFKNSVAEAKIQFFCYLLRCYGHLKYGKIQRTIFSVQYNI